MKAGVFYEKRALELKDGGKIDVSSIVYACQPLEKLPQILADESLRSAGKFIINPKHNNQKTLWEFPQSLFC